ncbi:Peroxisomal membrane protein PMP27 [Taxawa tesnikishii (nom. ined.)]|nr:Peroxisomal membrane protein PMP27 [Dothideales sp. JES 119]
MVADALSSLSPGIAVTHYNKFVATTVGRDKVLRSVQYLSRFLAWYLYRTNHTQSRVDFFEKLKKNMGGVRKAMRLGKFVEHFRAAATAADAASMDPVIRLCTVGRQLGYAFYMSLDTLTYLDAAGIRPSPTMKKLQREAYKAWMMGLLFSVVNSVYGLYTMQFQAAKEAQTGEKAVEVKKMQKERNNTQIQLVSDLCDLSIPLAALNIANLDDGIVGLLGSVSSLLGVYGQWNKTA